MKFTKTRILSFEQKAALVELWNKEYPRELQLKNIEGLDQYLAGLKDQNHILMVDDKEQIKGWYFDFLREDERSFLTIVDSRYHGKGLGTQLINLGKQEQPELNGWVINDDHYLKQNGKPYKSPAEFYNKAGFTAVADEKLKTDKITATKITWKRASGNE